MKRFTTLKMALALVFAFAVFGTVAMAQTAPEGTGSGQTGGMPGHGWAHHGFHGGMFAGLNLTDAQKSQMKAIREKYAPQFKETMSQIKAIRTQLDPSGSTTGQAANFDEATEASILTQTAPLQAKLKATHIAMQKEMNAVLTPTQQQQLAARQAQFKARMQQHQAASGTTTPNQ